MGDRRPHGRGGSAARRRAWTRRHAATSAAPRVALLAWCISPAQAWWWRSPSPPPPSEGPAAARGAGEPRPTAAAGAPRTDDEVAAFLAAQRKLASQAYEDLFGDGFGLEGEDGPPPPPYAVFEDNYVNEALRRETARILAEKGYHEEASRLARGPGDAGGKVQKKDAPRTLEGEMERLLAQKRQRGAIRERLGSFAETAPASAAPRRPRELLEPAPPPGRPGLWEVECGEPLYPRQTYGAIPGCTPGPSAGNPPCARLVIDGVATARESAAMVTAMDRAMDHLYHQAAETILMPAPGPPLDAPAFRMAAGLLERARALVSETMNITAELFYSGSLLKRLEHPPPMGELQIDPGHNAYPPHADKANIASYDWSALIYFNDVDEDFTGGELLFHDADVDRMVRPRAGRLVAFSSGLENLHRVVPLESGRRHVLAMWFTCSAAHAHPQLRAVAADSVGRAPQDDEL